MSFRAPTRLVEGTWGRNTVRDTLAPAIIVTALAVCSISVASGTDAAGADTSTGDCGRGRHP